MSERNTITLQNGDTLRVGQFGQALVNSRWYRAKVLQIMQGTGVERAMVEITRNGKDRRIIVGRYNLKGRRTRSP